MFILRFNKWHVIVSLFLFFTTCSKKVAIFPTNMGVASPKYMAKSIEFIRKDMSKRMGVSLGYPKEITFSWKTGDCLQGMPWIGGCITGIIFIEYKVVYLVNKPNIADSSLIHELIHYWQYKETGDIDIDHINTIWWNKLDKVRTDLWGWEKCVSYLPTQETTKCDRIIVQ